MHEAKFVKDMERGILTVERVFDVPVEKVWAAHTETALLSEWWAPKPWKAMTVSLDFREGGRWFYYMLGPEGEKNYCAVEYTSVDPGKSFTGSDYFCDEDGNRDENMPTMEWKMEFVPEGSATKLVSTIVYSSPIDLEKILSMGMEAGYTIALNQLEELLAK
jgi:uncharacterized protein YndB with AHSA1/START domain